MNQLPRTLKSSFVVLALIAGLVALPSSSAAVATHERGVCSTQTQAVTDLVGVSCKKAKRLARKASRQLGGLPECKGDGKKSFRGWEISGAGKRGDIIVTIFIKGTRSFIISGSGTC